MDTLAASVSSFNLQEPIPGYHLRERIGAGGYGEVWLADAPGGLKKAVKIVYGPLSAQRAETELKALQRIKQVQHPLLLSLERYEIVDEHLIIVTELAHGSLKDHFEEHVQAGRRGIPRGELLAYLRDVADALDYLFEKHSLQHLDVKPENLLLIADRVKVADFGLVKDLQDQSQSLVGGLTPLYAPPEVFDGRPNRHSDQYSLAIVYQELLTGEPPFAGRTVAQLAAQHLHSSPCLASLPQMDQPMIARALSKDPARRFPSCRKLIDSLTDAHRTTTRSRSVSPSSRVARPADNRLATKTVTLDVEPVEFPLASERSWLPPLKLNADPTALQPCIFVGVGGFGGKVLQQLRRRLCERFGNIDDLPAFQMLLIDTDSQSLAQAAQGDRMSALRGNQILPIPLRQPSDYRSDSGEILEWLNRRWLYNIPRSLLTEGIRPLGRLAFVDHYAKIAEALQHAVASATAAAAIQISSQRAGIAFEGEAPRVFVIGTTSGGTSSGCILDLGYALRSVLNNLRLGDSNVTGLLAHGIPRKAAARDLAIANTLGLLNEYRRYRSADGYPGEPACGLSALCDGTAPFDYTYLVSLGEDVGVAAVPTEARMAEYIFQASAGSASVWLDAARRARDDEPRDPDTLRTFGIHRIGGTGGEFVLSEADTLCRNLLSRWAGGIQEPGQPESSALKTAVEPLCKKFIQGLDLRIDRVIACVSALASRELGGDSQAFFQRAIADICGRIEHREAHRDGPGEGNRDEAAIRKSICEQIDLLLFPSDEHQECIESLVRVQLRNAAAMKVESLQEWLAMLINTPTSRVPGASCAVSWLGEHLDGIEQRLARELAAASADPDLAVTSTDDGCLQGYAQARLRQLVLASSAVFVRFIKAEVERHGELLYDFTKRLRQFQSEFPEAANEDESGLPAVAEISQRLKLKRVEMTNQLDEQLATQLVKKGVCLSALPTAGPDVWKRLAGAMRTAATALVGGLITRLQVATAVDEGDARAAMSAPKQAVAGATPELLDCGGAARLLLVAPGSAEDWPQTWYRSFAKATGTTPEIILDAGESITVCCEAEGVPLQNAVVKIAGGRADFYKAAARLQTRIDVEWPSLAEWISPSGG